MTASTKIIISSALAFSALALGSLSAIASPMILSNLDSLNNDGQGQKGARYIGRERQAPEHVLRGEAIAGSPLVAPEMNDSTLLGSLNSMNNQGQGQRGARYIGNERQAPEHVLRGEAIAGDPYTVGESLTYAPLLDTLDVLNNGGSGQRGARYILY